MQLQYGEAGQIYTWDSPEQPHDRLVIIGNGFDLECGLPTGYGDFIKFVRALKEISDGASSWRVSILPDPFDINAIWPKLMEGPASLFVGSLNPRVKCILSEYMTHSEGTYHESWMDFFDNFWYRHYWNIWSGKRWVDCEASIASVIRQVEDTMIRGEHLSQIDDEVSGQVTYNGLSQLPKKTVLQPYQYSSIHGPLPRLLSEVYLERRSAHPRRPKIEVDVDENSYMRTSVTYRDLRSRLLKDLNEFTIRFESYLRDYVGIIEPNQTPAIMSIINNLRIVESHEDTHVITFNYTSTLEQLLKAKGISISHCYVHGRLGNGDKCKLVLGMDEYLDDDGVRSMTDFSMFRKYNQRIYKQSDVTYAKWLSMYETNHTATHEVIVMGHSLAKSDHDFLRRVFSLPNTRISVYYHDDDSFSELLSNITAMMGKDYLVELTASDRRVLKFVDQRELT